MSKKHAFRCVSVKSISSLSLGERLGGHVVVGIDVAKETQYARFEDGAGTVELAQTVRWKHPAQTPMFFDLCEELVGQRATVEAVMEPSGTYGDSLRYGLDRRGVSVFRVSGKHVYDSREVFDGVPSLHDAKSTSIIVWLHRQGRSTRWMAESEQERELTALSNMLTLHEESKGRNLNRLEAMLARHWPEVQQELELTGATLWALLSTFGGPRQVAAQAEEAKTLMSRVGRQWLAADKIERVVASAGRTLGVPANAAEDAYLQHLAAEIERDTRAGREVRRKLDARVKAVFEPTLIAALGVAACAVLLAKKLDPQRYPSAKAFEKALGLNLVEKSSGRVQGRKRISKRGSGQARQLMYMAALRLLATDPVVKAWASLRTAAGPSRGVCVVVAVMRKLARAAWHVAKGEAFDSTKLFDVQRLRKLGALPPETPQPQPQPQLPPQALHETHRQRRLAPPTTSMVQPSPQAP